MPRYFTEVLTEDQLAKKIYDTILHTVAEYAMDKKEIDYHAKLARLAKDDYKGIVQIWHIGSYIVQAAGIEKDLSKVEFDTENFDCDGEDWKQSGFHTLDNGLTYFGIVTGGDWETPIFMIIYWDGKQLRGYIPKEGNPWNTDTKAAYGNDEECDDKNAIKRFGCECCHVEMDMDKIFQDIQKRIIKK